MRLTSSALLRAFEGRTVWGATAMMRASCRRCLETIRRANRRFYTYLASYFCNFFMV